MDIVSTGRPRKDRNPMLRLARRAALAAGLIAGMTLASPAHASPDTSAPDTSAPAPVTTPTTFSLPLFGVQLTVEVTTGPGGALSNVAVNPADGMTATTLKPNKVVFENAEGTGKVVVKSKHGGQKVEAKAGSLGEITGPGGWSGDLFGDGTVTTVSFNVGATADGGPDITGITASDPTAEIGAVEYRTEDDDDEMERQAKVRITFTKDGQQRTLTIKVKVETDDDGDDSHAKISISLGRIRGVALPAAEVAGDKTWTGQLCDGTLATIAYTVSESGEVSNVTVSPEPKRIKEDDDKLEVRFTTGERVKIRVRGDDGMLKISVEEKIRCDSPDPTVNTPTADDDDDRDDRGKDDNDDRDGRDDDDDDDDHDDDRRKDDGDDHGDDDDDDGRGGDDD
jgi:hypothetical protein